MAEKTKGTLVTASKKCFFITPIGDPDTTERRRADWLYNLVVIPACRAHDLTPERADLMSASAMIGTNIFRAISEAPICIADLTGLNPNVLYEMGVRHTLRLPIIHIAQAGTRLPFDTASHLTHFYDLDAYPSLTTLADTITPELGRMLADEYEVSNPFTQALGSIKLSESADPKERLMATFDERLRALETSRLPTLRMMTEPKNSEFPSPMRVHGELDQILRRRNRGENITLSSLTLATSLASHPGADGPAEAMYLLIKGSDLPNREDLLETIERYYPEVDL